MISSSPAIILSRVDLPQPEGPTKTTNSRSATESDTSRTASTVPKLLETFSSSTDAMSRYAFTAHISISTRKPGSSTACTAVRTGSGSGITVS